jgi:hypothetical protein
VRDELDVRDSAIASLETKLSGVTLEIEAREQAIAKLESELEAGRGKQLNFFPPEPTPTPTPEPVTEPETIPTPNPNPTPELKTKTKAKTKTNPKAKSTPVPEIDLASLIVPPGYKVGGSAELIEFVIEKFPNSELKTKGNITDAIRDRDSKKEGSDFSRLVNYEQECGFKHLGKDGAKHKFLIPIG